MSLLIMIAALLAQAQGDTLKTTSDPRIQLVLYDPSSVVALPVASGYAALVEVSPDERVDSVVVGNSAAWQVTTSRRGDAVVVKPVGDAPPTDMVIITNERRYVLQLQPASGGDTPYVLRFVYTPPSLVSTPPIPHAGDPIAASEVGAAPPSATYKLRGDKALFPATMRDDGRRTYVTWALNNGQPAVFAVRDGHEALINGRAVGTDYVIEGVFRKLVFRFGREKATASRRRAAGQQVGRP